VSNAAIRSGLEAELLALAGGLPANQTQLENKSFSPVAGTPYQRVNLIPSKPDNPANGPGVRRYRGWFVITLSYPYGAGAGAVEAAADLIAAHFRRGLSVTANQVTTIISNDPEIKAGRVEGSRWEVPIWVPYFANMGA
jgi:hypothetical protein